MPEMIDILNKLREYEAQGQAVGDAIKSTEMTQVEAPVVEALKTFQEFLSEKGVKIENLKWDQYARYAEAYANYKTRMGSGSVDEGGMSDVHIGAQEHVGNYVDDNGNLKMPKADVMKAMASEKAKATFPQSYEIETAMKMVADKFDDSGKAVDETVEPTTEAKAKPDYIDLDKDGNKTEPMKKAAKDKEMKKETVKEDMHIMTDNPNEMGMMMQILKLAGVQPVDAKMIGGEEEATDEAELSNSPDGHMHGSGSKMQSIDDLVNLHSGGLNKQKVQIKKGYPGDNELAAEDLANSLRNQYESFKKTYQAEAKKQSPYAIGMAQAMKSTGDKPPLEKSTIKKAHGIADKIKSKK